MDVCIDRVLLGLDSAFSVAFQNLRNNKLETVFIVTELPTKPNYSVLCETYFTLYQTDTAGYCHFS